MKKKLINFLHSFFNSNKKASINKDKMLEDIIFLPRQFHTGNMSSVTILKQSGYFKFHNEINNIDILNAINKYPEVINDWLVWSEDKRTGKGWVFNNTGEKYFVYYYPYRKKQLTLIFSNVNEACATFIKNEIEDIRK